MKTRLGLFLLPSLLGGCTSIFGNPDRDRIEGTDHSAFSQNLLIEIPLDEEEREADPSASSTTIQIGVSRVSGTFDQSRNEDDEFELKDIVFVGEGEDLDGDFDLVTGSVLAHYQIPSGGHTFGVLVGALITDMDVDVKSEGRKDSDGFTSIGVLVGADFALHLGPRVELFVRGSTSLGYEGADSTVALSVADAGAGFLLFDHFTLSGGWRFAHYDLDRDDDYNSDVEIHYSGPLVQLVYRR